MITPTPLMSRRDSAGSAPRKMNCGSLSARMRSRRAFTLVEVMAATIIFAGSILGVYAMMIRSYEMVTMARHRDNGRAILLSFADQFQRLQTTDEVGGTIVTRFLFQIATTPTGVGLTFTDSTGNTLTGTSGGLTVPLGDVGSSQVTGVVTRQVQNLNPTTGVVQNGVTASAAGWMLQGTFRLTYAVNGHPQSQQLVIARSVR
jgi:prepilin-type N-terminal cleavage/methylation domain-containing protein